MNEKNTLKLTETQNVIRNKFEKAYTNRLEKEKDVNHAMKAFTLCPSSTSTTTTTTSSPVKTSTELKSKNNDLSLNKPLKNQASTSSAMQLLSPMPSQTIKNAIKSNEKKQCDPNSLCDILRKLLASSSSSSSTNDTDTKIMQINTILDKLRKLNII